jgi:hypothetical protein
MKRYKFQALIKLDPSGDGGPVAVPPGQMRRMVLRGQHQETHVKQFFSAMITNDGDGSPRLGPHRAVVTLALTGDDVPEYFDIGASFALWLGSDIGKGVVTRRLYF